VKATRRKNAAGKTNAQTSLKTAFTGLFCVAIVKFFLAHLTFSHKVRKNPKRPANFNDKGQH